MCSSKASSSGLSLCERLDEGRRVIGVQRDR